MSDRINSNQQQPIASSLPQHKHSLTPELEKSEDGSISNRDTIIGEGKMLGTRQASILITESPLDESSPSAAVSKSQASSPSHAPLADCSGAGSPMMAKMYLLQRRNSGSFSSSSRAAPDQLAAPLDPLLAPLDCPRPTRAVDPELSASSSTDASNQPSALAEWDRLRQELSGKQLVVFLDYDGTLTPIVSQPSAAIIDSQQRQRLATLASKYPVAIVTGRKLDTIKKFLNRGPALDGLSSLYFAGSHGFDIHCPPSSPSACGLTRNKVVAEEYLPYLKEFHDTISAKLQGMKGALVEDNKFSISVHYRNVSAEDRPKLDELVASTLEPYVKSGKLHRTVGHEVHEIRANFDWHKGAAVNYLMQLMCTEFVGAQVDTKNIVPIYIGDDRTDEDAFRTLRSYRTTTTHPSAISIFVREDDKSRPSAATYTLKSPAEVGAFLEKLSSL